MAAPANDEDTRESTALQRIALPFELDDELVKPFADFIVLRVCFAAPLAPGALDELRRMFAEWVETQRGDDVEPMGEAIQMGEQTVELHLHGAQGDPDATLPPLLRGLAELARTARILRVEME